MIKCNVLQYDIEEFPSKDLNMVKKQDEDTEDIKNGEKV